MIIDRGLGSHPDVELARLGDVLDALEGLVLGAVHVEAAHAQPAHRQLRDREVHVDARVGARRVRARGDRYLPQEKHTAKNILKNLF